MSAWRWMNTGAGEEAWNMALDEALLEFAAEHGEPVLRFYGWTEAAATFGYFQHYAEIAAWTKLRPLIRRPTGGGLVPHDADWTYSVVIPPAHEWCGLRATESYRRMHEWIVRAMQGIGVPAELAGVAQKTGPGQCFIGSEKYDVLLNGKKIAGVAQRRNREGLLIQGSIQPQTFSGRRGDFEQSMLTNYPANWTEFVPTARVLTRARELVGEKFGLASYNQRR